MANMMIVKYEERERKEIQGVDVPPHTGLGGIKDSKWRKECKSLINRARNQVLIQKNRREAMQRQSRVDVAQLLVNGQHDDALERVVQLHNDQRIISAYDQIEKYCEYVHTNLKEIASQSQSQLSSEATEAVSSLVFAASRCGELPELNQIRMLFKNHFGDHFDRNIVELKHGNSVNSQLKYNLGSDSVSDDVKRQITSEIARERNLRLQSKGKDRNLGLKLKDVLRSIWLKFSTFGSRNLKCFRCGPNEPKGLSSRRMSVSSRFNVKKMLAPRPRALTKKERKENGKRDGLHRKNQRNDQEGTSGSKSNGGKRLKRRADAKPRLGYVHPKLPDYDDLVSKFTGKKEEHKKTNPNNKRTLWRWMRR